MERSWPEELGKSGGTVGNGRRRLDHDVQDWFGRVQVAMGEDELPRQGDLGHGDRVQRLRKGSGSALVLGQLRGGRERRVWLGEPGYKACRQMRTTVEGGQGWCCCVREMQSASGGG